MKGSIGLTVRAAGCLTLLLLAPVLLIRAQPYDGSAVRDVLLPEGCAPPCFLGLRPGESTLNDAILFFEQRPRVHFVVQNPIIYSISDDTAVLYWREDGSPISGSMNFDEGKLMELTVQGLNLSDIWLTLGEPDSRQMAMEIIYMDSTNVFSRPTAHLGYYSRYKIRVQISSTCLEFWNQFTYIMIGQTVVPDSVSGGPTLAQQRQVACEQERAYLRMIREG